ncbi:MAG: exo-alpha-sialidase [Magnetococcales bacterium]|nr:exo-alpha-sialidase [Magnetococcales bacterium]
MVSWRLEQFRRAAGRLLHRCTSLPDLARHAPLPLITPTADGSGQVTHPDVIAFPSPWRGHRFWMVMTPFPFLDATLENPSILASDDGLTWAPPSGLVNPLIPAPERGFHADPDLIHHPESDELWLYFLHTIRGEEQHLIRMVSTDGRHWSAPQTLFSVTYQEIRSPALAIHAGRVTMWSVNMRVGATLEVRESTDGITWEEPYPAFHYQPGFRPSHVDVVRDPLRDCWWMVVQATPFTGGANPLFLAGSPDGRRWWSHTRPLLGTALTPEWANQTLYRSTLVMEPPEDPRRGGGGRLWYAGRDADNRNRVGHTRVPATAFDALRKRWT